MQLEEAKKLLAAMKPHLEKFRHVDEIEYDYSNKNERFEASQIMGILENLNDALQDLKYMNRPVLAEGKLKKRTDGRYEIAGTDFYFTSGSTVEIWESEDEYYYKTTIEHRNGDYYAVNVHEPTLENLTARIR